MLQVALSKLGITTGSCLRLSSSVYKQAKINNAINSMITYIM